MTNSKYNYGLSFGSHYTLTKDNKGQFLLEYTRPIKTKQKFVGRTKETNDLLAILAKPSKANVMLTGDAGIGKTALVKKLVKLTSVVST